MTSSSLRRVMHLLLAASATSGAVVACGGAVVSVDDGDPQRDPNTVPPIGTSVPGDPPVTTRDASVPDRGVPDARPDRYADTCVNGTIPFSEAYCCPDGGGTGCYVGGGGDSVCALDCTAVCNEVAPGLRPFGGCSVSSSPTKGQEIQYLCGSCGVGRVPAGTAACPRGGTVAARLAMQAYYEAASVDAFQRVAELLDREGAPEDLVRRAMKAARDERRHARLFARLAKERGMRAPSPEEAPVFTSLFDLALENAREGQVRETYGALVALHQAQHAVDPALRAAFAAIADDEIAHAALSWDLATWLDGQLTAAQRAQVHAAHADAKVVLRDLSTAEHDVVDAALGMPSPEVGRTLFDGLFRDLAIAA